MKNKLLFVLILIFLYLFYSQNQQLQKLNTRLTDIEDKRLKLIEDKFGGDRNLKCSESETVKKVRNSIVRVIGGEAEGSGFVINDDGYVLTNFHVIEFQPSPKVIFSDNTFETVNILYADKNADLAVLKIDKKIPAIDWGNSDYLNPTEEILVLGYPLGGSL